jgi:hypothetical protein
VARRRAFAAMNAPRATPCGAWASPLAAAALAGAMSSVRQARAFEGRLYWAENRPAEGGRVALLARDADGRAVEIAPPQFSVRTRVHEYGGLAYVPLRSGLLVCNDADQRLYRLAPGQAPQPLTAPKLRYADGAASADGTRVYFVREDHRAAGEPRNEIVAVDPQRPAAEAVLFCAADFVAFPRPSPDGGRLAFISWDHPQMPWDGTRLHVGRLTGDRLEDVRTIAGGAAESVLEPCWDDDGTLYFVSDRSGW